MFRRFFPYDKINRRKPARKKRVPQKYPLLCTIIKEGMQTKDTRLPAFADTIEQAVIYAAVFA